MVIERFASATSPRCHCGRRRIGWYSAKDGDPARLQGWAVLENQSGADWNDVALTLQYGNPVTFRQAIYQSYYVQRPEVPVEILGRILPSVDTRARPAESAMQKAAPAAPNRSLGTMAAPAPMPM